MNSSGHFLVFDLTKIGTAYQIINSFADADTVNVFEISPIGSQALLILMCKDLSASQLFYNQCISLFKSEIIDCVLIENIDDQVVDAYLSQNQSVLQSNMLVVETNTFAKAFLCAHKLQQKKLSVIDFRAVRTSPPNLIIVCSDELEQEMLNFMESNPFVKTTFIPQTSAILKSYFNIIK